MYLQLLQITILNQIKYKQKIKLKSILQMMNFLRDQHNDANIQEKQTNNINQQDQTLKNIKEERDKFLSYLDQQPDPDPNPSKIFFQKTDKGDNQTHYTLYLPAQFNIKFKKLDDFDFDNLNVLIEATYFIRIKCLKLPYLIEMIQKNCQVIFQNSLMQRLVKEQDYIRSDDISKYNQNESDDQKVFLIKQIPCHFIYKNYKQSCIQIMFTRSTKFKIQPNIKATPFQWFNLYQQFEFCPLSFIQCHNSFTQKKKYIINLKINFPNFAKKEIQKLKRQKKVEQQQIKKLKEEKKKLKTFNLIKLNDKDLNLSTPSLAVSSIIKQNKQQSIKTQEKIKKSNQTIYQNQNQRKKKQFIDIQRPLSYASTFRNKYYRPVQNGHYIRAFYYQAKQKYQLQNPCYIFCCCPTLKKIKYFDIPIKELLQQNFKERKQHGQSFNQIRIKISIYKKPWVLLLFFLLPVCILGILNISVLFQSPQLKDRIASLATIMVAYFASLYQIRQQLSFAFKFTFLQQIIYTLILLTIMTLIESLDVRDQNPVDWHFDWEHNYLFWLNILFGLQVIFFYILFIILHIWSTKQMNKRNPYFLDKPYQKKGCITYDNFFKQKKPKKNRNNSINNQINGLQSSTSLKKIQKVQDQS